MEQRFLDCINDEMMEDALENLPETLEGLYADQLRQVRKDYKEKVRLILMWLTYSLRPLSLVELASAVSIPNPQKVLEICTSSLVSLQRGNGHSPVLVDEHRDVKDDVVKLDHFSVKEYLTSRNILTSEDTAYFHADSLMAHLNMAEISVAHLITTNDISFSGFNWFNPEPFISRYRSEFPLLGYSIMWYIHIQQADAIEASARKSGEALGEAAKDLRDKCHTLLSGRYPRSYKIWLYLFPRSASYSYLSTSFDTPSPIFMASLLDLSDNVRRLLDDGANVDGDVESAVPFELSLTINMPVYAAAISGSLETLRLLLRKGATLDQSTLEWAVVRNTVYEVDVLTTILEARPDLGITDGTMNASASNFGSKEVLNYILDTQDNMTKSQLEAIARNYSSYPQRLDMVEKIVSYGKRLDCDGTQMLRAFLQSKNLFAGQEIRFLIDQCDLYYSMGQEIVSWALQNELYGFENAHAILEHYKEAGVEVVFTPDMEIAMGWLRKPLIEELNDWARR